MNIEIQNVKATPAKLVAFNGRVIGALYYGKYISKSNPEFHKCLHRSDKDNIPGFLASVPDLVAV